MIRFISRHALIAAALATMIALPVALVRPSPSAALPSYAAATGQSCGACHVNPAGGGPRNAVGSAFEAIPSHVADPAGAWAQISGSSATPTATTTDTTTTTVTSTATTTPTAVTDDDDEDEVEVEVEDDDEGATTVIPSQAPQMEQDDDRWQATPQIPQQNVQRERDRDRDEERNRSREGERERDRD